MNSVDFENDFLDAMNSEDYQELKRLITLEKEEFSLFCQERNVLMIVLTNIENEERLKMTEALIYLCPENIKSTLLSENNIREVMDFSLQVYDKKILNYFKHSYSEIYSSLVKDNIYNYFIFAIKNNDKKLLKSFLEENTAFVEPEMLFQESLYLKTDEISLYLLSNIDKNLLKEDNINKNIYYLCLENNKPDILNKLYEEDILDKNDIPINMIQSLIVKSNTALLDKILYSYDFIAKKELIDYVQNYINSEENNRPRLKNYFMKFIEHYIPLEEKRNLKDKLSSSLDNNVTITTKHKI